jgi:predicted RND superfamily exporter protein
VKSLDLIQATFNFLIYCSYKHFKLAITFFTLLIATLLFFFKPLPVHVTLDKMINKDFETSRDYFQLKSDFNLGTNAQVMIEAANKEFFRESELCHLRSHIGKISLQDDLIQNSYSPFFLRESSYSTKTDKSGATDRFLNFPPILKLDCEKESDVKANFEVFTPTPFVRNLFSPVKNEFMHEFTILKPKLDSEGDFDLEVVPNETIKLINSFEKLNVTTHWIGDGPYQFYFKKGLDINNALNILIFIIIIVCFRIFFGTFISSIIYLFTLVISIIILFSLMSLFNTPIDILNNSLILLLTVSSLGDFVFLTYNEFDNSNHWIESFKKIVIPSFFTSLTTFIGFISLSTSSIDVIKRLGLWAGISGLIEWLIVFIVLPSVLRLFFNNKKWINHKKAFRLKKVANISMPKKIIWAFLIPLIFVPYAFHHINISDIPSKLFKENNPFRQSIEYLYQTRGFRGDISLVFNDRTKIIENKRVIQSLLENKEELLISKIDDPYDILEFYQQKIPLELHPTIEDGLKKSTQYQRFFFENKARAVIFLKDIEMKKIENIRHLIKNKICIHDECEVSGALVAYAEFSQKVPRTLIDSFILSLLLVFLVLIYLAYATNNLKKLFSLTLSSFWGVSLTIILISLLGVRINFVTCVVISILVGMTGDNTIQYILAGYKSNLSNGIDIRSEASIVNTLIMIICSLVFLLFYFEPPTTFGLLLVFGLLSSLVGDFWILKGMLKE